jgi:hypothetical protein
VRDCISRLKQYVRIQSSDVCDEDLPFLNLVTDRADHYPATHRKILPAQDVNDTASLKLFDGLLD